MQKREQAQTFFRFLFFVFLFFFALFTYPVAASAQGVSPTPGSLTPAATAQGTPALVPEIPTPSPIMIIYPVHGLKLTGVVNITGSVALDGWTSYEAAFAFADDQSNTWFTFAGGTNPLPGTTLASWKTTSVSDGDYNLRLRVFSPGGFQDGFVYGLRVRNYTADTPVPTLTLTPTATSAATTLPTFTPTVTSTVYPSPTALPPNPATLGAGDIVLNLGGGALIMIALFGAFGLLTRLRR